MAALAASNTGSTQTKSLHSQDTAMAAKGADRTSGSLSPPSYHEPDIPHQKPLTSFGMLYKRKAESTIASCKLYLQPSEASPVAIAVAQGYQMTHCIKLVGSGLLNSLGSAELL